MLHDTWFFNEATVICCSYALVSSADLLGYHQRAIKSQETMKTCQTSIKQSKPKKMGERKVQDGRTQVQAKKKEPPTRADGKGT